MADPIKGVIGDYEVFIQQVASHLDNRIAGGCRGLEMDHICYRVETMEQYRIAKASLGGLGTVLLTESKVGGRPICIFQLSTPIRSCGWEVSCIELPAPKAGSPYPLGLEHAEMVIGQPGDPCHGPTASEVLDAFVASNPSLAFDIRALKKDTNADVSLSFHDGVLGRKISVKFHVRPIYEVIGHEASLNSEADKQSSK